MVVRSIQLARLGIAPGRRYQSVEDISKLAGTCPPDLLRGAAVACLPLADLRVIRSWQGPHDGNCFSNSGALVLDSDTRRNLMVYRVPAVGADFEPPVLSLTGLFHIRPCEFSPDDRLVAVSHYNNSGVTVCSLDNKIAREFPNATESAFMPDGTIAVTKARGPLQIYDLKTDRKPREIPFDAEVELAISPDGTRAASWNSATSVVRVGSLETGQTAELTTPSGRSVRRAAWHPDGKRVAVAGSDGSIWIWNAANLAKPILLLTITGHESRVIDVQFNHRGDLLVSSSRDDTTRLWDAASGEPLVRLNGAGMVQFGPDDRTLMIAGDGGTGERYGKHQIAEVAAGRERRTMIPPAAPAAENGGVSADADIAISPDGLIMACCDEDVVRFWNLGDTPFDVMPVDLTMPRKVTSLAFDADGTGLVAAGPLGAWRISILTPIKDTGHPTVAGTRRIEIGLNIVRLPAPGLTPGGIAVPPVTPNRPTAADSKRDELLATCPTARLGVKATPTGGVILIDPASGAELTRLDESAGDMHHAAFSPTAGNWPRWARRSACGTCG